MSESNKNITDLTHPVILFDGVCNVCNFFVQFVIKRDPQGLFHFASLQSDIGKELLQQFDLSHKELKTVVMIDGDKVYTHSDVPLEVAYKLGGAWSLCYFFKIIPKTLRNTVYDWIARNRYRWFGKKDQCMIPTPDVRQRFLDF